MIENPSGKNVRSDNALRQAQIEKTVPLVRVVEHAARLAQADAHRVFVVGGIVRDIFSHGRVGDADLDLVVEGDGIAFAHALSGGIGGSVKEHRTFCTAKLLPPFRVDARGEAADPLLGVEAPLSEVDVASARTEQYIRPGALPEVTLTSIEHDLFRRDFSINAVAVSVADFLLFCRKELSLSELQQRAVDPCRGIEDLREKRVRILHPRSFIDDPTRLFRCVRYSVRLGLSVDEATTQARGDAVRGGALRAISTKRIWNELVACALESHGVQMLQVCGAWGLFERAPFLGTQFLSECVSVVERLHSIGDPRVHTPEMMETVIAATILRASAAEIEHESPIYSLQLPRPVQRKATALAKDEAPRKGAELFESNDLFGTLRRIVTGVG
jgi:tRNA nucleotidyltransferase (CCA-adding enzyme)